MPVYANLWTAHQPLLADRRRDLRLTVTALAGFAGVDRGHLGKLLSDPTANVKSRTIGKLWRGLQRAERAARRYDAAPGE